MACSIGNWLWNRFIDSELLKSQQIDSLYLNDLYNDVADLDQTIDFGPTQIQPLIGDIEQLELPQAFRFGDVEFSFSMDD